MSNILTPCDFCGAPTEERGNGQANLCEECESEDAACRDEPGSDPDRGQPVYEPHYDRDCGRWLP